MFFANVKGGEELRKALTKNMGKFEEAMDTILPEEARELMNAAQTRVPRESGELASTATVSSEKTRGGTKAVAAYTDEKAAAVHEGVHHGHKVHGTKGFKWFERTLNSFEGSFAQSVVEKLKSKLGL